ncbi:hypothetical protein L484_006117 [Morus notabilis]|uniref:Uncharacterized protein n=1 Tax=Morus notabilis TaxID=981085 RepID=W9RI47_9ROSA|nr:hypothetical protein L484_006117 [Morus notabilis]
MKTSLGFVAWLCCIAILVFFFKDPSLDHRFGRKLMRGREDDDIPGKSLPAPIGGGKIHH